MSSTSAPLRVTLVDAYEIAELGLAAALAPFRDEVQWVPSSAAADDGAAPLDVVLYEPIGLVTAQRESVRVLSEVHRVPATIYTWRTATHRPDDRTPPVLSKRLRASDLVQVLHRLAHENRRTRHRTSPVTDYSPEHQVLGAYGLASREAEILLLVAAGLSNQEIGSRLYLSVNSIKTYLRTGYRKIGVTRRTQVVAWAIDHGLPLSHEGVGGEPDSRR